MKQIIDMSADRGAFICQSQSLNLWQEDPTYSSLTNMHFYAWKSGLKTGMYYLRTKSAVDAIKFTLDNKKATTAPETPAVDTNVVEKKKAKAAKTAEKFAEEVKVDVEPMTAEEMKALIEQAKASEGDDCLMCGS